MIKYENEVLQAELLDSSGLMLPSTIKNYNYIACKNNFEKIIDILFTNKIVHSSVSDILNFKINNNLCFCINDKYLPIENTIFIDRDLGKIKRTNSDTQILTINRAIYDQSINMCLALLRKVRDSFNNLNEAERYIIKSLEFDLPHLPDEELIDNLRTYNKNYYNIKRSAYIKLALQLDIYTNDLWNENNLDFLKDKNLIIF